MSRYAVSAAGLLLAISSIASAQYIGLYAEPAGINSEIVSGENALNTVYIVIHPGPIATEANAAAFSVDIPSCPNMIFLGAEAAVGQSTGSVNVGGVLMDFEQCLPLPAHVMSLNFFTPSGFDCCELNVFAHSSSISGSPEVADCSDTAHTAIERRGWLASASPHVINRYPPDGATNVSVDVTMSWDEYYCAEPIGDVFIFGFYFGTENPPPEVLQSPSAIKSYQPGNLAPNTTYYWQSGGYATTMPVWSFTTAGIVPADESTWGKIKSLYR